MEKLLYNIVHAFEAVMGNLLRSILTALGIIFGVGAVITMLAVGRGAKQEILEQMKLVGVNNIIIEAVHEDDNQGEKSSDKPEAKTEKKFSGGLTLEDAESIASIIPGVERVSPEIIFKSQAIRKGHIHKANLVGVSQDYFTIFNHVFNTGNTFNRWQEDHGDAVCVITSTLSAYFFSHDDPVGKMLKVGDNWYKVIGILKSKFANANLDLGLRSMDFDVYVPAKTILLRQKNRALITENILKQAIEEDEDDEEGNTQSDEKKSYNYNQIDKLIVQITDEEKLRSTAEVVHRLIKRRHLGIEDFKIIIPELLLQQQQRTKNIFNIVLGAIAAISLLVGGIGIMNIMLASVWERIREIGVRQAVGATKKDVIIQFLSEAVIISLSGGFIGAFIGIAGAYIITKVTGIVTIVTISSVILSFFVAASIGLIFGIMPAKRAAEQDPIKSLRHE